MSEVFNLEPTNETELNDLAARGMEYIKEKLVEAEAHIPEVRAVADLAVQQDLSDEDKYIVLAYRALVDIMRLEMQRRAYAQEHAADPRIISSVDGKEIKSELELP